MNKLTDLFNIECLSCNSKNISICVIEQYGADAGFVIECENCNKKYEYIPSW